MTPRNCDTCRHAGTPTAHSPQCRDCAAPDWRGWEGREARHPFTLAEFRAALVRADIVDSRAIDDPEGYDGGRMRANTERAWLAVTRAGNGKVEGDK
jgi:hypothetical protein